MTPIGSPSYDDWKLATPPEYEEDQPQRRVEHCRGCGGILPGPEHRGNCSCPENAR